MDSHFKEQELEQWQVTGSQLGVLHGHVAPAPVNLSDRMPSCTWQEDLIEADRTRTAQQLRPCALVHRAAARLRTPMRAHAGSLPLIPPHNSIHAVPARAAPAAETAGRAPMSALYRAVDMHSSAFLLVCFCAALPDLRCGNGLAGGCLASGPWPLCSPSTTCIHTVRSVFSPAASPPAACVEGSKEIAEYDA
jgi:hypothetical protein